MDMQHSLDMQKLKFCVQEKCTYISQKENKTTQDSFTEIDNPFQSNRENQANAWRYNYNQEFKTLSTKSLRHVQEICAFWSISSNIKCLDLGLCESFHCRQTPLQHQYKQVRKLHHVSAMFGIGALHICLISHVLQTQSLALNKATCQPVAETINGCSRCSTILSHFCTFKQHLHTSQILSFVTVGE